MYLLVIFIKSFYIINNNNNNNNNNNKQSDRFCRAVAAELFCEGLLWTERERKQM